MRWSHSLALILVLSACDGRVDVDAATDAAIALDASSSEDAGRERDAGADAGLGTDAGRAADAGIDAAIAVDGGLDAGECAEGEHRCDRGCVSDTAVESCGDRCEACPAPSANGTATCTVGACAIACDDGFAELDGDCVAATDPAIDPPTPIAPASGARLSTTPSFRYALAAGTDGARLEICADRACATVVGTVDALGASASLAAALAEGRWFYRLFGRLGPRTGTRASAALPFWIGARAWTSPVPFLDIDGDAIVDLVVGAPGATSATNSYLAVYLGTADGDFAEPPQTVWRFPSRPDLHVGTVLASAGDVDGDGFGDVIMGGGLHDDADHGTYVLFGAADGLDETRAAFAAGSYRQTVAGLGDVDGDGDDDVARGDPFGRTVRVYDGGGRSLGAPLTLSSPPDGGVADNFGEAIAPAGDVNGDGFADLLVGDPGRQVSGVPSYRGAVYLFLGGAAGLDPTPIPLEPNDATGLVNSFGRQVVGLGDVNGDGYGEVAISARWSADTSTVRDDGAIYLFWGSAAGPSPAPVIVHGAPFEQLGARLSSGGDVTGDGVPDLLMRSGVSAYVVPGDATAGLGARLSIAAASVMIRFGAPGDLDGDGHAEIVVAMPCPPSSPSAWCTGPGSVVVFDGATRSTRRQTLTESAANLRSFGWTVAP